MSFKPREYQSKQIKEVMELLPVKQKLLLQLPTGGGKTVMFSLIARDYIAKYDKAVIILVHRKELMDQAAKTVREKTGYTPVLINQDAKYYKIGSIYIAMVDSLKRRMHLIENIGLVIIDECHIANFNKIHNVFKSEFFIGVSATPVSSSKKDPLKNYYNEIIQGVQIPELIKTNFLSQNITRVPKNFIDASKFKVSPLTGDYDEKDLSEEYQKVKNIKNTVEAYKRFHLGKKTIVFNINIKHSMSVNDEFISNGFNSKHLDSNAMDRDEILKWFKETPDAILNNVMIATVGYDEPTIRAVMLNFDTLSLPKFLQTCGRGGRIIDRDLASKLDCEPKYKFDITDMGSNAIRFGDWSDERDWKEIFDNPDDPPKPGSPPKKVCPSCSTLVHLATRICDCGYVFPLKGMGEESELGEFIMVTKNIDIENLNKKETSMEERLKELEIKIKKMRGQITELNESINNATDEEKTEIEKKLEEIWDEASSYSIERKELKQELQPKRFKQLLQLIIDKCHEVIDNNDILEKSEKEIFVEKFVEPYLKADISDNIIIQKGITEKENFKSNALTSTSPKENLRKNEHRTKAEKTILKVTFPNGLVIQEKKAIDTFVKTILAFGIEKVIEKNGDSLIIAEETYTEELNRKYKKIEGTKYYLKCDNSTNAKKEHIEKVGKLLKIGIRVETI